jgi:uncharacterized protein YbjT (DUF2867 family)
MILIVGATGRLGNLIARKLLAQGNSVRAMTRNPAKAEELKMLGAEVIQGDLRDPSSLRRACQGIEQVLAAAHAFDAQGDNNPKNVDGTGNLHLIDTAKAAGVKHFVFTSILGVSPKAPVDLFVYKYQAEEYLKASGLSYTILRAAAFMEFWAAMVGDPILKTGKTTIFGGGNNPINFVSVEDVAQYALFALQDQRARNRIIEVGGPENITLNRVAEIFQKVTGCRGKVSHVPLPVMRVMSTIMQPLNPALARQIKAGVVMDTTNQEFNMKETLSLFPIQQTRLEDYVKKKYT